MPYIRRTRTSVSFSPLMYGTHIRLEEGAASSVLGLRSSLLVLFKNVDEYPLFFRSCFITAISFLKSLFDGANRDGPSEECGYRRLVCRAMIWSAVQVSADVCRFSAYIITHSVRSHRPDVQEWHAAIWLELHIVNWIAGSMELRCSWRRLTSLVFTTHKQSSTYHKNKSFCLGE